MAGLTSNRALDLAFDLGAARPRIVTIEEWNGSQAFLLTFGEMGSGRKQIALRPSMTDERAKEIIQEAMEPVTAHKDEIRAAAWKADTQEGRNPPDARASGSRPEGMETRALPSAPPLGRGSSKAAGVAPGPHVLSDPITQPIVPAQIAPKKRGRPRKIDPASAT